MKNGTITLATVPVALLFLALFIFSSGIAAADDEIPELFSSPSGSGSRRWNPEEPWIVRARLATVNLGRVYESARRLRSASSDREMVSLNLFEDITLTARIRRVEHTFSGGFTCYGTVRGYGKSEVIVVVKDTIVSANISVPGAFYQVRYVAPGIHSVQEVDQSLFPSELTPIPAQGTQKKDALVSAEDSGDAIDILVAYTGEASSAAGGTAAMHNNINLMISETNKGYANSGVSQRLRLVHVMEVSYSESEFNWSTTLDRFRRTTDGYMDSVHGMRDTYGADAAVLIVNNSGSCGIAYVMQGVSTSFASFAFAVVSRSCATGYYSFAHELGHVMGCGHDRDNASVSGSYDYSFGYQAPDESFRTVMAYNCPGGCNRINYWSNPEKTYNGQPMGVDYTSPLAADNRRALNNTATTIANFRQSAVVLTVNRDGIGSGTVTSNPAGVSCGSDCSQEYTGGDPITLSAAPDVGSTFSGWSGGGCSGTGPCTVSMSSSKTVTATFDKVRVGLTVEKAGNGTGTVTSSPSGIACGGDCSESYPLDSYVTLYAAPVPGAGFVGWSGGGCSGTGSCRVLMDQAKTVTATFSNSTVRLSIDTGGIGSGTVTSSPSGITCGGDCDHDYTRGDRITLTAAPDTGSTFAGWTGGGCSGSGPCTVTMNSDTGVTALFDKAVFYLKITTEGNGSGAVTSIPSGIDCGEDCNNNYTIGSHVTLSAQADAGSEFAGWSGSGCSGVGPCTVTINGNRMVTARFDLRPVAFEGSDVLYVPGLFSSDSSTTDVTIVNTHEYPVVAGIDYYSAEGSFVSRSEISIGRNEKVTLYGAAMPSETAAAIVSAESDLVGYVRHVDAEGKRSAWPACSRTMESFSIPHIAGGTWWKTELHLFNPLGSDTQVRVVYDSETSMDVVLQAKATYTLTVDTASGEKTPSYIETSQPLTAVEFFDCLFPGGDKAAVVLGGEAIAELMVPNILHDQQGWTGIGIGFPTWAGTVVAIGATPEGVFDLSMIGDVLSQGKVSANLSTLFDPLVSWARVLGVNYDLIAEVNGYVVPIQGIGIYGDPALTKIGAVNLDALRFEQGVVGVVSPAEAPAFAVVNPHNSDATLMISTYGESGGLTHTEYVPLEAGQSVVLPLSQYLIGAHDGYIEVKATMPLYGYETFTAGGRMEMLPVLQ